MFTILITEIPTPQAAPEPGHTGNLDLGPLKRFEQTLDTLDVSAVIRLVNTPPRKKRGDAGKGKKPAAV